MNTPLTTMKYLSNAFLLLSGMLALTACKKDEEDAETPPPTNEEEVITTVVITFTDPENTANTYELRFSDPDGAGGNAPTITSDPLPASFGFVATVRVLNESVSPAVDLTPQIQSEGVEHQFFYQTTGANLSMSYGDADANGKPIGLLCAAATGLASSGSIMVTLRHGPDKNAANVAAGDITNAGGETDAEVSIPVTIQ